MQVTIFTFCLIGAVFSNPISFNAVLESRELDTNTTESMSISQSSENDSLQLQSSEENSSNQTESFSVSQSSENESSQLQSSEESSSTQSSESESLESTSKDTTSEESNSQSDEEDEPLAETSDNSMGSEENVRKSWLRVFASVVKVQSAEDNSSTEVKGHSEEHLTKNQPSLTSASTTLMQKSGAAQGQINMLVDNPTASSDTTSDSADTSDVTGATAAPSQSSESTSSESNETSEASNSSQASDSSDASNSTEDSNSSQASNSMEDSNSSDSAELKQINAKGCVNGTQSCESEEYFFQDIGDDAHYSVDNLMMPDEDYREFSLRR